MGGEQAEGGPKIGLLATVVLVLALVVPFGVRQLTAIEPYPSVILPEGGTKLTTVDGIVSYHATMILGRDADGALVEIEADEFLDPIWSQYLRYMARNEFGLGDLPDPKISVRGTGKQFTWPRRFEPSQTEREEIEAWLAERLAERGLQDTEFVVRRVEIAADADSGTTLSVTTTSEQTFAL